MNRSSASQWVAAILLFVTGACVCKAVETHTWEQSDQAEFERGTRKGLAIRSDGRITLSPEFKELDSTNIPYLWTLSQDSRGTIYYAGGAPTGATTRIMALPRNGKPKTFAILNGLEVHALAIDSHDEVYAAVLPDAKIYRIDAAGKAQLFFDPKCKYIWAMVFDKTGNLFVATGDSGLVYKVTPEGKGTKFFDTQETHARSLAVDGSGNLIIGTEPSGLILRVSPEGKGFVLYQAKKREVTSVAMRNGFIYAAVIGNKSASVAVSGAPPVLPSNPTAITGTGAPRTGTQPPSLGPAIGSLAASVTGGSEVYRIHSDGFAERIWTSPTDLIYAITFDADGKPLLGTGNKGSIYRVDSDQLSTELIVAPPTQVTAFLQGQNGIIYATTGNVGNLYSIGPATEKSGWLESEVLDANEFALWGRAHLTFDANGGAVKLETRSGNLSNPQNSWSAWTKVEVAPDGGAIASPSARFLQYRLTMNRSENGNGSPELSSVAIPFLPRNIAPRVQQIEIAPINYREPASTSILERSVTASGSPLTLTLPPIGQRRGNLASLALESTGSATLQYSKGYVTVRWNAADANGDSLLYRVEIRPAKAADWQLLKDKLADRFYAFDSNALPDGQYKIRITASDGLSNTPANTLTASMESDPFTVDNTPPEIVSLDAVHEGQGRQVSFTAKDALSWIDKAEYSVDGAEWIVLEPKTKVSDSKTLAYQFAAPAKGTIAIRVFDENDNVAVRQVPTEQ